jgi:hypothetical protein
LFCSVVLQSKYNVFHIFSFIPRLVFSGLRAGPPRIEVRFPPEMRFFFLVTYGAALGPDQPPMQ